MGGADGDRHVLGLEERLESHQDLLGEALLHLRPPREELHDAVDLGEADDALLRHVGDLRLAVYRHEMVLAGACDGNVADLYHLVDVHLVLDEGNLRKVRIVEPGENLVDVHLRDAPRRVLEGVILQIKPQGSHDASHMILDGSLLFLGRKAVRCIGILKTALHQRVTDALSLRTYFWHFHAHTGKSADRMSGPHAT